LALAKPIGVSKKFCLLDVAASSHARAVSATATNIARVPAFDNLGNDSLPDVRKTPFTGKDDREAHITTTFSVW
jgi:hypothetical protein